MPVNGFSSAAAALRYWERRQEIAANNIANVDTTGFKAGRVFGEMLGDRLVVAGVSTDLTSGAMRHTGNSLDIAISSDAFLVVDTPNGPRMTRGGSFGLDPEGRVVDANGNALQTDAGPIIADGGSVSIARDGTVTVDGRDAGRLTLLQPAAGASPTPEGAGLFVPNGDETPAADRDVVHQGHLEESNVGAVDAMVEMIAIQRAYASVQKAMTVMDSVRETISNSLARPG